ncbi:hypothetical protein [Rugamonas aquatica]|uniref:DUF3298 domain-containing protein n=1 Tax=Rugamonas aquatica TaxID=2743357 RepID=A0A6A7N347_9BURK|nr:hypothetical protein [Rugamonas aquatica]MQA39446.1 hypothetical protein [Rugamonas aquatica]
MKPIFIALIAGGFMLCAPLTHAESASEQPTVRLTGGGEVPPWAGEPWEDSYAGGYPITWNYPVFKGLDKIRLEKLNAWARTISLQQLFSYDGIWSPKTTASKDSAVIALLSQEKAAREAALTQSVLMPSRRFVRHITFTLYSEMPGAAHPSHGLIHPIFDYRSGQQVETESLFKQGAKGKLTQMLEQSIERSFKETPALNTDDLGRCQHNRQFEWEAVSILSNHEIIVEFPSVSGENASCGEGYYILRSPAIKKLLVSPQDFGVGEMLYSPTN